MVLFGVSSVWAAAGTTTITAYAIYDSNNDSIYEPGGGTVLAKAVTQNRNGNAPMNENGDYVAGKKLELNYRIYQQSETMGVKESTEAKGYVHVDLDETAPYVRTYSENYEVVEGYGEKESHSASAEAWTYVSGMQVVFGYEYKVDGQVSDSGETTVALSNAETELLKDIQEAYYQIHPHRANHQTPYSCPC